MLACSYRCIHPVHPRYPSISEVGLLHSQAGKQIESQRDQMEGRGCDSASSKRSTSFLNLNPMDMKRCAPRRWIQWHYIQVVTASIAAPSADVADANVMPKREHSASVCCCCCCCALEKKLNEEGKALVSWSSSNLLLPSSTTHPNYELYCICPLSSYIFCSPPSLSVPDDSFDYFLNGSEAEALAVANPTFVDINIRAFVVTPNTRPCIG